MKSCELGGKTFSADIYTWNKPTPNDDWLTEAQTWGNRYDAPIDRSRVEATKVLWRDGTWHGAGPFGYRHPAHLRRQMAQRPFLGPQQIGYHGPTMPVVIM